MDTRETNHKWWKSFDEKRMILTIEVDDEEIEIPAVYEVCSVCDGKGKHVNPSIDSNGLSREDFDEDPDFAEDYFSGLYDVQCYHCNGNRVEPNHADNLNEELKKIVEKHIQEHYEYQQELYYERKYQY